VRVVSVSPAAFGFPHALQVIALTAERTIKRTGETSVETRYHVTSRSAAAASPRALLTSIRDHWAGIENRSHWCRDALWGEDRCRSRRANLAANLALLRLLLWHRICRDGDTHLPGWFERVAHRPALGLRLFRQ
jgi:predicted transposase YbfD/YdcC